MKRAAYGECTARKRRCRALSHSSTPEIGHSCKRPQPASTCTPPSPIVESLDVARSLEILQQAQAQWAERASFISAWVRSVPSSRLRSDSSHRDSFPADDAQVPDTMSESSRLRDVKMQQRRPRSCSPTKKSPQYRSTVLRPANILVDATHSLPPAIEALLPCGLRDILDPPPPAPPSAARAHVGIGTIAHQDNDDETDTRTKELADKVSQLAAVYRDECRELAGKPGSEPEYRSHLYGDVVEKLARISPWRRVLSVNCSDKPWRAALKPPAPTPILSLSSSVWPSLPLNSVASKGPQDVLLASTQNSLDSDIIRVRPDGNPFNFTTLPEPSESSTASELEGTLTTPKPDITVGISREAFSSIHAGLLGYWQAENAVLSDPHATQGDMRFPFLIIEAKGLATNGNLIGAQNQAAGGGACAIRLLESLAAQDSRADAPRIVFSITTEGAMHELWVHYWMVDEDNIKKYHMTCLGAWRTTLHRHANEFVAALATIFSWGVDVFHPQIKQVLDRVLDAAIAT
jgi:hypothetical protein